MDQPTNPTPSPNPTGIIEELFEIIIASLERQSLDATKQCGKAESMLQTVVTSHESVATLPMEVVPLEFAATAANLAVLATTCHERMSTLWQAEAAFNVVAVRMLREIVCKKDE